MTYLKMTIHKYDERKRPESWVCTHTLQMIPGCWGTNTLKAVTTKYLECTIIKSSHELSTHWRGVPNMEQAVPCIQPTHKVETNQLHTMTW